MKSFKDKPHLLSQIGRAWHPGVPVAEPAYILHSSPQRFTISVVGNDAVPLS